MCNTPLWPSQHMHGGGHDQRKLAMRRQLKHWHSVTCTGQSGLRKLAAGRGCSGRSGGENVQQCHQCGLAVSHPWLHSLKAARLRLSECCRLHSDDVSSLVCLSRVKAVMCIRTATLSCLFPAWCLCLYLSAWHLESSHGASACSHTEQRVIHS